MTSWGYYGNVSPYAVTCTRTTAQVGDSISLRANGTGSGVGNTYTVYFLQTGGTGTITNAVQSGLGEGIDAVASYVVQPGDIGQNISFSAYVVSSCGNTRSSSPDPSCTVAMQPPPCTVPVCNFVVS